MVDMDWSDDMQVINFFNDVDSGDKFEGFGLEDSIDFIDGNNNILAKLPISDFSPDRDRDFVDDIQNGWTCDDLDVNIAPFTREANLTSICKTLNL